MRRAITLAALAVAPLARCSAVKSPYASAETAFDSIAPSVVAVVNARD